MTIFLCLKNQILSTHDLTRRSTNGNFVFTLYDGTFNSRPHKEVDQDTCPACSTGGSFNSRPHKEVDFAAWKAKQQKVRELSTHDLTRRSTVSWEKYISWKWSFNSRPHKEVDFFRCSISKCFIKLSTHDLTRRSTIFCCRCFIWNCLSTHDLTRRSTVYSWCNFTKDVLSTHDLTRRSTRYNFWNWFVRNLSTHDLTRRSTSSDGFLLPAP